MELELGGVPPGFVSSIEARNFVPVEVTQPCGFLSCPFGLPKRNS